jgi:hypothetical protein
MPGGRASRRDQFFKMRQLRLNIKKDFYYTVTNKPHIITEVISPPQWHIQDNSIQAERNHEGYYSSVTGRTGFHGLFFLLSFLNFIRAYNQIWP